MNYWLMKSEPETFSIDDLKKMKREHWDGIRNYQARNMMRDDMKKGDLALFYHSNTTPPGIVGVMEIVKESYPDFTAFDPESKYYDPKSTEDKPRWFMVDVKFKEKFKRMITLSDLRANAALKDMLILRKGNRLSITPVTKKQWDAVFKMV
ncbi:MAG: EVE domain-containing protein [Legionellaceae bacterium]|nr:EVE domain-containing protein [Legionellaceae bacterium]